MTLFNYLEVINITESNIEDNYLLNVATAPIVCGYKGSESDCRLFAQSKCGIYVIKQRWQGFIFRLSVTFMLFYTSMAH